MKIGDRIEIIKNISLDDTIIGSRGKIARMDQETVVIHLDDYDDEYFTSIDGDDFIIIKEDTDNEK